MRIDSEQGRGTKIELILPATEDLAKGKVGRLLREAMPSPAGKAILLVDDDDNVRAVLGEQLRELGFKVDEAADGKSAIERLKGNGSYDVLLTDFAMPGMNGLDTIRTAVRERPELRTVLMTGYANEGSVADAREQVPIVRKPIRMEELLRQIG